ncbi:MAG TPA: MFS transporter [Marmoricola sp.]
MSPSRGVPVSPLLPAGPSRRPILVLSLGTFALGTDAFVISGVLPRIQHDLGVGLGAAGQLITLFSVTYALGAPVMAVLTARWGRRNLLLLAMTAFVAANLVAAAAPTYAVLMGARVLAALTAALFAPAASATAAMIAGPEQRGRALAAVLGGLTVANAVGVPLGTLIGQALGWRSTFVFVAALSAVAVAGLAASLGPLPSPAVPSMRARVAVAGIPGVPTTLAATGFAMSGVFVLYSYLAWFSDAAAGVTGDLVSLVYLVAGLAAVLSNIAAGWLIDRLPATRGAAWGMSGLVVTSLGLAALGWAGGNLVTLCALLGAWSLIGWWFNPAHQQRLLAASGEHGPIALSLNSSAIYAGQALAGGMGALALGWGAPAVAALAGALVMVALGFLAISERHQRPAASASAVEREPAR